MFAVALVSLFLLQTAADTPEIDPCTVENDGGAWAPCQANRARTANGLLRSYLAGYPQTWPADQRQAFETLIARMDEAALARVSTMNLLGTLRGAQVHESDASIHKQLLRTLWRMDEALTRTGKADELWQALAIIVPDERLSPQSAPTKAAVQTAYRDLLKACCEYPIKRGDLVTDQAAWERYRKAWEDLARLRWPSRVNWIEPDLNAARLLELDEELETAMRIKP